MNKKIRTLLTDILFIGPVFVAFACIVLVPLARGVFYSFFDWNGLGYTRFVGLQNFVAAFSDAKFLAAFWFTCKFALVSVVVVNLIGFLLALLVTQAIPATSLMRAVFYMPNLIGGLTLGFIWNFIFVVILPELGAKMGVTWFNGWLADATTGFWGLVILTAWQMSGYMMIIYIAALQNIPGDVVEAGMIDGAGAFRRLVNIKLPLLRPAFTVSIFLTLSNTFKLYDQNLALTGGGPGDSTQMISMHIYNTAYVYNQNALGQAKAVIFMLVVMTITLLQVYMGKKKEVAL